jgi:hypothetical protein
MDYTDSTMAYAYLVGFMDCATKIYGFEEWINEANKIIDRMDIIEMNYDQFEDLMDLYNGSGKHTEEINDITYIIVGDNDENDADINGDLYGIVYMENYIIKLISLAEFNKLKDIDGNYKRCDDCGLCKVIDDMICEVTVSKIWTCCDCIGKQCYNEKQKLLQNAAPKKVTVTVKKITIEGVLYYISKTDILYDTNTREEIGVWNSETKIIEELPKSDDKTDEE